MLEKPPLTPPIRRPPPGRYAVALLLAVTLAGCAAASGQTAGGGAPAATAARLPLSSTTVQAQPPRGSCHARGSGLFTEPDLRCTPGATNPAVTQADIASTICRSGWTRTVRPPSSVTGREKRASMAAYGDTGPASGYEYDHDISLELGGAPNDPRNLWPEPGEHNPKDALENKLKSLVCHGTLTLVRAQRLIAGDWVTAYKRYVGG
jgi:hypothetical protein